MTAQALVVTPVILDALAMTAGGFAAEIAPRFGDGRTGGYFFACDGTCRQLLHKKLLAPDPTKLPKYREYSREKAERLLRHPEHMLSWQSREPKEGRWGGAVRLQSGIIFSFSGFPELVDEAFCAALAFILGWAPYEEMLATLRISNNVELFEKMVNPLPAIRAHAM